MKLKFNLQFYTATYFFVLLLLYHFKVKTYFYWRYIAEYLKDTSFDFSIQRLFIATVIFYINLWYLKRVNSKKLSFATVYIFFLLITIPSLIAFTSKNMYPFKLMLYHQLFFWSLLFFSKVKLNLNKIPSFSKKQGLAILTFVILLGTLPYIIILGPYINLENLFLADIYETRVLMASKSNVYFAYMYSPFTKIIIPLFIVFALERKKWGLVVSPLSLVLNTTNRLNWLSLWQVLYFVSLNAILYFFIVISQLSVEDVFVIYAFHEVILYAVYFFIQYYAIHVKKSEK